ncbi:WD repeat-containing protein 66-like isoform X2 [Pseudomyrmex gracilis]|uniref:WD repeat-containing protein 66-like isoform X2 n=1 Tax=Pseudomyrmex gracilis TaxID=219809 RepID=UPI0009955D6E|nr:WD repeat-containing protein 66-like isoform X2 [Pseudomyrmex gracilis]
MWLMTADFGTEDSAVMVWDTEKGIPVRTLFNPHGNQGLTAARISPDAKHVVTVGNEKCQNVHFWLLRTREKNEPDGLISPHEFFHFITALFRSRLLAYCATICAQFSASVSLIDTSSERVKEIAFDDERTEQFALTTDRNVVFLTRNGPTLNCDCPEVRRKFRQNLGIFNGSCYVSKTQQVATGTTNGYVLIWETVSPGKTTVDDPNCQRRKHIQTISLQKSSINVIVDNGGKLVTGSSNGQVTFYNYQFKLLYWCENRNLDSVRWISHNLRSDLKAPIFKADEPEHHQLRETRASTVSDKLDATNVTRWPSFNFQHFLACSSTGVTALIQMPEKRFHLVFPHPVAIVTSVDAYPESNYLIVGDARGIVRFYNWETRTLITSKSTPPLPDFLPILEKQTSDENIVYVTCPRHRESSRAVTALKFSPKCIPTLWLMSLVYFLEEKETNRRRNKEPEFISGDLVVCGLENGAMWILHHITLDPLDEIPYKHSSAAISKIAFGRCSEWMAYADDELTVAVFRRNDDPSRTNVWNLIGKYRSHRLPVRDVIFGPAPPDSDVPQLFSLGEDRELIEYDLRHSGPYPVPGLQILRIRRIEQSAVPLCLAWYRLSDTERFLVIANSEYKYKIFCDSPTKAIRGTYLGPTYGEPVQQFQILTNRPENGRSYMVFATEREIGLQLLPLDGNPYKIVGVTGHSQKITGISISRQMLFTTGRDDPCVLMWKINFRSVDAMAQFGGERLAPFYRLIEGGRKGTRLMSEMKDMFDYAKILDQGECSIFPRVVSDTVVVEQIPNLMRAVGYFPTNEEIENMLTEVCYKRYVKTGELVEEITFEDFVRLYANHRPAFGIGARRIREAFRTFVEEDAFDAEVPTLTRERFVRVLLGDVISGIPLENSDPLTPREAREYLELLLPGEQPRISNFLFLPSRFHRCYHGCVGGN